ncbi:MAG: hypothetical protein LBQ43_04995 [Holosporales bacterium]|jgi:hypothetical protein|nr:hypothetical protein [Holosporales bacterium]
MNILSKLTMSVTLLTLFAAERVHAGRTADPIMAETTVVANGLLSCVNAVKLMALHKISADDVIQICKKVVANNEEELRMISTIDPSDTRSGIQELMQLTRVNKSIKDNLLNVVIPQHTIAMEYSAKTLSSCGVAVLSHCSTFPTDAKCEGFYSNVYSWWGISRSATKETLCAYNRFAVDFNEYIDYSSCGFPYLKLYNVDSFELVEYNPNKIESNPHWFGLTLSTRALNADLPQ